MTRSSLPVRLASILFAVYHLLNHTKITILTGVFGYASVCKHQPSCSQFALNQIKKHGIVWGFGSGLWRLLTCW